MPKFPAITAYTEITTAEEAVQMARIIRDAGLVAFDTETIVKGKTPDKYSDRLLVLSWCLGDIPWNPAWGETRWAFEKRAGFVCRADPRITVPITQALEDVSVIAHNYSYDAHVLHRACGVIPGIRGKVYDTVVMDHLVDENRFHSLEDCSMDYDLSIKKVSFGTQFKAPAKSEMSDSEWGLSTNPTGFLEYASSDACVTLELFSTLRTKLQEINWKKPKNFFDYYEELESQYVKSIWEMEKNGVCVNAEVLKPFAPEIRKALKRIADGYAKLSGKVYNLNSVPQIRLLMQTLGVPIIKRTKLTHEPSYDADALERLMEMGHREKIEPLLEYRKLEKLRSQYIDGLQNHIRPNGRVHTDFRVAGTVTNRLSSAHPNLQNLPRPSEDEAVQDYGIRAAFVAPPGRLLVVADFDQLEVKLAAQVSGDRNLISAILNKEDQHARTAERMFNVNYQDVLTAKKAKEPTKAQRELVEFRSQAKTVYFGVLYGMSYERLAREYDLSIEEAKGRITRFFEAHPELKNAMDFCSQTCEVNGYITTKVGRRRNLPEIWSATDFVKAGAQRQAFNFTIQGLAADLMRFYMPAIAFDTRLREMGALLVLQVHDEVIVEVPENNAQEALEIVIHHMETSVPDIGWKVPITASAKIADNWAKAK